jgi:signal transduction histidine kinase
MADPENRIFCRLDGLTPAAREQRRLQALRELGLLESKTVTVFDEATQTAAQFLDAPICIFGLMTQELLLIESAVGLSRLGLMNQLAQSRQLPRDESFCTYVVDSHQVLAIHDTATSPIFTSSLLVGVYGIRAYLGAPLLTVDGQCIGTLAVMDVVPRCFTSKDIEFLAITARWSLSEFERNHLLRQKDRSSVCWLPNSSPTSRYEEAWESNSTNDLSVCLSSIKVIKVKLLAQLTQELRTPLTSVMGMASVLGRQVYGPLTSKQQEYLEVIHGSGQHLVSLVDEIVELGTWNESSEQLRLTPVDIQMLCQQAINALLNLAQARQQQMRLWVEPGNRIWLLDKDKVRQLLYYLLFSVIQSAEAGSEVRIHVSRKSDVEKRSLPLQIAVWVSHWMEGIDEEIAELPLPSPAAIADVSNGLDTLLNADKLESNKLVASSYLSSANSLESSASVSATSTLQELNKIPGNNDSRESLGLLLSFYLAEVHGGHISMQGSAESGTCYIVSLPQLESVDERL